MKKLTIILAHADYSKSIANKTIVEHLQKEYPNTEVRNLTDMYPDFQIDIESEQQNLLHSDVVLFQFPIYWFNMPAILKQWFDTVLSYGFAYGEGGEKLKGKIAVVSATAGGSERRYQKQDDNKSQLKTMLNNIESSIEYCGMTFHEPILGYDYLYVPKLIGSPDEIRKHASEQANRLIEALNGLLKPVS